MRGGQRERMLAPAEAHFQPEVVRARKHRARMRRLRRRQAEARQGGLQQPRLPRPQRMAAAASVEPVGNPLRREGGRAVGRFAPHVARRAHLPKARFSSSTRSPR